MKDILHPWVIIGAVITASLLLGASFLAAGLLSPNPMDSYGGGAVLTVIPLPTATPTPTLSLTLNTPTAQPPNGIQVGGFVQIADTEGEGLRLRRDPSLNGEIVYLGLEGEIFQVKGGPEDRDGYLWWQLVAPLNADRTGWAVSNYLEAAQGP
jgi:hypothetical protein